MLVWCLVFGATNNFSCFLISELPSFAKEMIAQAVEWVWSGESSGTPGQDYAVAPLLLPPHPSQYCFPEARQIKIKLNSSTESDTSGNACGALN